MPTSGQQNACSVGPVPVLRTSFQFMMKNQYLYIYLLAIRDELFAAAHAHTRIAEACVALSATEDWDRTERYDAFEEVDAEDDLTASIEALLSAYARLSLFLFPHPSDGARAATRGKILRERLGVPEDHALAHREPRNTWMHLDAAIDRRIWEGDDDSLILRTFGSARLAFMDDHDRHILRLIDPKARQIVLLGESYNLDDIFRHVDSVSRAVKTAIEEIEAELVAEWPDLSKPPASLDDLL